jgi:hypothetical protein
MVGGLIVSQALTLFTTPVVYLYLDQFRLWLLRRRDKTHEAAAHGELPSSDAAAVLRETT